MLMAENKELAFEALHSPYVALGGGIEQHPATEYFVAAWTNESDFYPSILNGFQSREHAVAVVREWNRFEKDSWIPEDSQ